MGMPWRPGHIKTLIVAVCGTAATLLPLADKPLGLHPATYLLAFLLPIFSLVINPIGRRWFAPPSWWNSPLVGRNRLAAAQFGAVFFAVVSAGLYLGSLRLDNALPELLWLGLAFGGYPFEQVHLFRRRV